MPRAASQNKLQIKTLKLSSSELAMAKDFVEELGIGTDSKYYYYALMWCKNNQKSNGDFLTPTNRTRFDKETANARSGSGRPGALHLKILYDVTKLESKQPDTDRLRDTTPATNTTLRANRQRISRSSSKQKPQRPSVEISVDRNEVEKGESYTVSWKSENASHVSRSTGFETPIVSNNLTGSVTINANRIGSKSFSITVRNDQGTPASSRVTINVVAAQVVPPPSTNQRTRTPRTTTTGAQRSASNNTQVLMDINKSLTSVIEILKIQNAFANKIRKLNRKYAQNQKRKKNEELLEAGKKIRDKAIEKVLSPIKNIFEKIWRFIVYTLLGRAFSDFIKWFNDPKNADKVRTLGRFIKDFWPIISGALLFFFIPFKGFILKTLFKLSFWTAKLLLLKNPLITLAALVGGFFGTKAIEFRKGQDKKREQNQRSYEKALTNPSYLGPSKLREPTLLERGKLLFQRFDAGGFVDNTTGIRVSGAGEDTQLTALKPGEVVMNTQAVRAVGANKLLALNALFGGPNANKPKKLNSNILGMSGGGIVGDKNPSISDADYNALLAISAAEDFTNPQGRADVAQSIYNRLYAANKYKLNFGPTAGKNTIKNIITGDGQYQPTFKNREDWLNIKDRKSAAVAFSRYKKIPVDKAMKVLEETDKILKNPVYQQKAQKHVQGRTYFLGSSQQDNMKKGDVVRSPEHNFFSHWYSEGTPYQKERGHKPAPIPINVIPKKKGGMNIAKSLLGAPRPSSAATRSKAPQRPWWDPRKWIGKRGGGLAISADFPSIGNRSDDRHPLLIHNESSITPILTQAGEQVYVIPKTVVQRGGINIIDNIVGQLDRTSEPARLQAIPKQETLMSPMAMGPSLSQVMSLPAITNGTPNIKTPAGNKIPSFPTVSPMAGDTREWLVKEMYNIL
jgi:hypothetical protein